MFPHLQKQKRKNNSPVKVIMESKVYFKIGFALFFCCIAASVIVNAQAEFNQPWLDKNKAIVIDAFHKNSIDWSKLQTDRRVAGIIHKASEGLSFADPKYKSRRILAKRLGYKWGSYHLLRKGNPIAQARFYLETIGSKTSDELMALDIECTTNSACNVPKYKVSIGEIEIFLKYVKQKTGRYPILYANQSVLLDISKNPIDKNLFERIALWYARFKKDVDDFPKDIWKTYTFWQFSSEINCKPKEACLYRVPGTEYDMDINVYNGTADEMRRNWAKIGN